MTAFARESAQTEQGELTVELRSVNHRYLDMNFKLPDSLRSLEGQLREAANKALARGKLDCLFRLQAQGVQQASLDIDQERLQALLDAAATVSAHTPGAQPLNPLEVLQFPGVCGGRELSEEALHRDALALFKLALGNLEGGRRREGAKLEALIRERLDGVRGEVAHTRTLLPDLMQQQRDRVINRIEELGIEADQNRLEQELVHLAQKADVDEELDRLEAHVEEVARTLDKGGPCGRRLDFLMQELNREANTLSSKSLSSSTTQRSVELKVLIEQMREQIQNIE
ncbi:MAG: YicC/YloC family endoribonuclease [Pseudomonadota bacterium]